MFIKERFFQINNQWNVTHLPERPNGFGVLIIGDMNHYVDEKTSSWIQHPERCQLIKQLTESGYTVFYSNLYGRNWGSPKAVYHLSRLYKYIMKREILNPKIHIMCEGMGSIAGLNWLEEMDERVRSVVLINPCIDLKKHVIHEKDKKLFYKRLLRELSSAYDVDINVIDKEFSGFRSIDGFSSLIPTKIWHITQGANFSASDHSRKYENHRKQLGYPIELSIQLPRNQLNKFTEIHEFLNKHENVV
jgi:hypothetical protein